MPRCLHCGDRIWSDGDTVHSSAGPVHRGCVTPLYAVIDGDGHLIKDGNGNLRLYQTREEAETFVGSIFKELGFSVVVAGGEREIVQRTIFYRRT